MLHGTFLLAINVTDVLESHAFKVLRLIAIPYRPFGDVRE